MTSVKISGEKGCWENTLSQHPATLVLIGNVTQVKTHNNQLGNHKGFREQLACDLMVSGHVTVASLEIM